MKKKLSGNGRAFTSIDGKFICERMQQGTSVFFTLDCNHEDDCLIQMHSLKDGSKKLQLLGEVCFSRSESIELSSILLLYSEIMTGLEHSSSELPTHVDHWDSRELVLQLQQTETRTQRLQVRKNFLLASRMFLERCDDRGEIDQFVSLIEKWAISSGQQDLLHTLNTSNPRTENNLLH